MSSISFLDIKSTLEIYLKNKAQLWGCGKQNTNQEFDKFSGYKKYTKNIPQE